MCGDWAGDLTGTRHDDVVTNGPCGREFRKLVVSLDIARGRDASQEQEIDLLLPAQE